MSGLGLRRKVFLLFGLLLRKILLMLVMRGVGVVSLRGAPLALPTFVTAQFKSFFDCGRAVRCLLPLYVLVLIFVFFMVIKVLILILSNLL